MTAPERIFLVGPMGAGKTTVGRTLARLLNLEFVDSDAEIERRTGADIPWIFEIEGEEGFRDREQQVLTDLATQDPAVIATGGGAILRQANREVMRTGGYVVYLEASVREQVRRTGKDSKRPLLAGKNREQVLSELMKVRSPLYTEAADLVLPTVGKTARQLADAIVDALTSA